MTAIAAAPKQFPLDVRAALPLEPRRARVSRFPYSIVFLETPGRLRVIAVAHDHRRPGYWRDRAGR